MGDTSKGNLILIPGLGAPLILMKPLGMRLKHAGYNSIYMRYSLHTPLEYHVEKFKKLLSRLDTERPVFIVAHSYGSTICRNAYRDPTLPRPEKIVMIAPVNQGSTLAQTWYDLTGKVRGGHRLMGIVAGPVPFQIRTEMVGRKLQFPVCSADVGVISLVLPDIISKMHPLLNGPNDGTSTVQDTYATGLKDFIVMSGEHNTALLRKDVALKVIHFLDTGWFREQGMPLSGIIQLN